MASARAMRRPVRALLALLVLLWPAFASAHSYSHSQIKVGHVWALPSAGPEAQVFMPLYNGGEQTDRLARATTAAAAKVAFRDEDGREAGGFDLPPRRPLAMRPGRRALILKGLKAPIETGQRFDMTLHFEKAGAIKITVWVEEAPSD